MKTKLLVCLYLGLSFPALAQSERPAALPQTPKRPVTDVYFGKAVVDNYRWLEDMNSAETKDWFKAQADYSNHTLDQIPGRDALIKTFTAFDGLKTHVISGITRRGGRYFYRKTLAGENVGKIYMSPGTQGGKPGAEQLVFDPVAYDKTKTYSVTGFIPSEDGRKLSIGLQEGGAELSTVRFLIRLWT